MTKKQPMESVKVSAKRALLRIAANAIVVKESRESPPGAGLVHVHKSASIATKIETEAGTDLAETMTTTATAIKIGIVAGLTAGATIGAVTGTEVATESVGTIGGATMITTASDATAMNDHQGGRGVALATETPLASPLVVAAVVTSASGWLA